MSATFRILDHRVGEGLLKHGVQVQRIQQLLFLNGFKIGTKGVWHSETTDALLQFQAKIQNPTQALFLDNLQSPRKFINPRDPILFELAYGANVLIRLAPGGSIYRHAIAFEDVHDWCEDQKIKFDMRNRAVWGLDGYQTWAIVTEKSAEFGKAAFDVERPRALNCTLYANLMMSVWKQGNAHGHPFSADVSSAGWGTKHFASERYHDPVAGEYSDVDEVRTLTRSHPHQLYCLEYGKTWTGHYGLMLNGRVYECNYGPTPDVHWVSLDHWVSTHSQGWVLGPAPW